MVVEVVTESLDVRDDLIAALQGQVPWEENCNYQQIMGAENIYCATVPNVI